MQQILSAFQLDGAPVQCNAFGSGHINETYHIQTDKGNQYVLQKINHHVFTDVPALMHNIVLVTKHLAHKVGGDPRRVQSIIETTGGTSFFQDGENGYWRLYTYIEGLSLNRAESIDDFKQSGVAFGRFQYQLSDFPAETLYETIPAFHHTPTRFSQLSAAVREDREGRAKAVQADIDFALAREAEASIMVDMAQKGVLPLRVTHNDTKLNNVLLDTRTREPLCVVDLDTVMPGLVGNDFGDSIRFGASTGAEDEPDLSRVQFSLPLYSAYAEGFLSACQSNLTKEEIATLPLSAKLLTLECGVRFLADYLNGDVYFHISRPNHNLDRARTQFKLLSDMEAHWDEMRFTIDHLV